LVRESAEPAHLRFTPEVDDIWQHVQRALRAPASDGSIGSSTGALVLVDGASGTGKTSLAAELAARWPTDRRVVVVHMDDLYGGWDGLAAGILALEVSLLTPRSWGEDAHLGSYNWVTQSWDDGQVIPAGVDVIVEGCGSFGPVLAQTADARIWLEAPEDLRRERALGRGAEDFERHWDMWEQQFQQFERRVQPSERASLRVWANH
jgi:uridine kinase